MPALTSVFSQWLLHQPVNHPGNLCTIVLHGEDPLVNDDLVAQIAGYLNEYDDAATGGWLCANHKLLERLTTNLSLRSMLGLGEPGSCERCKQSCKWPDLLRCLAERGRVVCIATSRPIVFPDEVRVFRAGIGNADALNDRCHITIDPDMALTGKLPQILADVFLEWNHSHEPHLSRARGA